MCHYVYELDIKLEVRKRQIYNSYWNRNLLKQQPRLNAESEGMIINKVDFIEQEKPQKPYGL